MPIRRRNDGEIVEELTQLQQSARKSRTSSEVVDSPTDPLLPRTPDDETMPPERYAAESGSGSRLEAPTSLLRRSGKPKDARTRIVRQRKGDPSSDRTPAGREDPMLDPPVGWLVVVRGPGKGRVVTLGNGMNVIGRGAPARARIDFGDESVSRTNHARVVYEPRQRRYLLSHGDGSNLTYLNREVVMTPVPIESGAMIEIGETTLRFQAFCSKDFDWPDVDD